MRNRNPAVAKVAIVTGASRGIGRRLAMELADNGWSVVTLSRSQPEWAESYPNVHSHIGSVSDTGTWRELMATVTEKYDRLDVLVNNAGVLQTGAFVDGSAEKDADMVQTNVVGVLYGCRAAIPLLTESRQPVIVNLCSTSAIYGTPEQAVYSATKFAVRGISEALDLELAESRIKVKAIWPMYVDTEMLEGNPSTGASRMGVNLTPDEVTKVCYAAITEPTFVDRFKRNYIPGLQGKLLYWSSSISPSFINRIVVKYLFG